MSTRSGILLVVAVWCAGLLGCVSADVYRVKEQEVLNLHKVNEEMQVRNKSLFAEKSGLESRAGEMKRENDGLKDRVEKQIEEIAHLKNRTERLEKDKDGTAGAGRKVEFQDRGAEQGEPEAGLPDPS